MNPGRRQPGRARSVAPARSSLAAVLLSLALLLPSAASTQDYSLDFYTVDGGGEILSESDDQQVQLSGTLGQWDSTELIEQSGGGYTLTGGFWPVNIEQTDLLFRDGFEG